MSTADANRDPRRVTPFYAWATLVVLFLAFGSGIFALDIMPPLFLEITRDFPLTATQMGAVIRRIPPGVTLLYAHRWNTDRPYWPATDVGNRPGHSDAGRRCPVLRE